MLSIYNTTPTSQIEKKIQHYSANACLTPLCSLDGFAVTTIEGIGGMRQGLHPAQSRLAELHGSQCGFCTPGIVMALYAHMRTYPNSTPHELEEAMDGNLCRCTGYRPIIDAVKSLSNFKGESTVNDGCCGGGGCDSCPSKSPEVVDNGGCCGGKGTDGSCCMDKLNENGEKKVCNTSEKTIKALSSLQEAKDSIGYSEPIFPPQLMRFVSKSLRLTKGKVTWFQPVDLSSLLKLKTLYPEARLVIGNTEVGIETKFKGLEYPIIINPAKVLDLRVLNIERTQLNNGIRVGANVSITSLRNYCLALSLPESGAESFEVRGLMAIHHMLTWFASNQIRNVACVAGNICTASPISDLNPMLMALGATLRIVSPDSDRELPIKDFFLSYRKVDLKPNEILHSVFIPFTSKFEFVVPLKQARRREDDISIVTAGFRYKLAPNENKEWIIEDCCVSFGGVAPFTLNATKTSDILTGKKWNAESFEAAYKTIRGEFNLPDNVPGGQAEYRMSLTLSFLFKSFLIVIGDLQCYISKDCDSSSLPSVPIVDKREKSAAKSFVTSPKPSVRGEQTYSVRKGGLNSALPVPLTPNPDNEAVRAPVGDPIMHKSAKLQVSGEAIYADDMKKASDAVHAALVTSTKVHARLLSIDTTKAESCPGFVQYYCAKDVPGSNAIGAIFKDEEVFATEYVKHYGQVIGVILCDTHEQALYAARMVDVKYEDLPHVVSIEEAIAAQSFHAGEHEIKCGDIEDGKQKSDFIVEGRCNIGGQEHFYLETNATYAVPGENGALEIFSSTQNPTKTQNFCASVCGIQANNVVARCKRMGGGFGGKETRSVFIACTAALSAHLLGRPVSINIERDLDMSISGQRHAFLVDYKAGCNEDGKLTFLDAHLYSNAGFSYDLSQPVMDRALFHSDNCYKWPAFRAHGTLCKTNQPTHTAFRGFGGPQGLMMTEMVMEHLSKVSGIKPETLRGENLYSNGDQTHFGQELEEFYVPRLWSDLKTTASVSDRMNSVDEFNTNNKWKKRGITSLPVKFGINFTAKFMNQGGALVHVYTDGTVLISHGGTEMGQGLHTKMIQVASRCFDIPHTSVHIAETSTDKVANQSPTAASMSTDLYGMAVLDACEQILKRLEPIKATLPSDTTWYNLIQTAFFSRIDLSAHGYYAIHTDRCGYDWDLITDNNTERGLPFNYFTQGVACTEVEIDCLTGDSTILRVDILMDLGKSVNPAIDIGQIEGAYVQGSGWCTTEELVWGDTQHKWVRPGQLFTRGPGTYKIPSFNDTPLDFRVHLSDTETQFSVHSSKAVGEPPLFLGGCTFFALQHAVMAARKEHCKESGDNFYQLHHPATSERIRMACTDEFTLPCTNENQEFHPKGSW
jgi:xanthine dehydrogenase/oxidase